MKILDEATSDYKKNVNFRIHEKSCGNCKYFDWDEIKSHCRHKDLAAKGIAWFGVEANNVCDNFEEVEQ